MNNVPVTKYLIKIRRKQNAAKWFNMSVSKLFFLPFFHVFTIYIEHLIFI